MAYNNDAKPWKTTKTDVSQKKFLLVNPYWKFRGMKRKKSGCSSPDKPISEPSCRTQMLNRHANDPATREKATEELKAEEEANEESAVVGTPPHHHCYTTIDHSIVLPTQRKIRKDFNGIIAPKTISAPSSLQ